MTGAKPVSAKCWHLVAESSLGRCCRSGASEAKRSLLNFFATALGSCSDPAVTMALTTLMPLSGARSAADHRARRAASIRSVPPRQRDLGEPARFRRHPSRHHHPSGSAGRRNACWRWLRRALCTGRDVLSTPSSSVSMSSAASAMPSRPGHYRARLAHHLDLRNFRRGGGRRKTARPARGKQSQHALGIVARQSAGIVENLPSAAKNVSVGNSARNGIFAAFAGAEQGCQGGAARHRRPARLGARHGRWCLIWRSSTSGLGQSWEIAQEHLQALSGRHRLPCRDRGSA